jgi:hypothetical protein
VIRWAVAVTTVCLAPVLLAACGDNTPHVDPDDVPLVDGASIAQDFERPNGIYPARIRLLVVEGPDYESDDALARAERSRLIGDGWRIEGEPHEPRVGRAYQDDRSFTVRFGPPGPMIRVAGLAPGGRLEPLAADRPPTIIVQASPDEQTVD